MATGMPCWYELATSNLDGAKAFYSTVFGWTPVDYDMGPDGTYTILQLDGKSAGAAYKMPAAMEGVPPHWAVYFEVADADASAARVTELGGKVVMPPFNVEDMGRMLIATDPGGASFCLWQVLKPMGNNAVEVPNAVCWTELATRDIAASEAFYGPLLGWTTHAHPAGHGPYAVLQAGGKDFGGFLQMDQHWGDMPAHWSIYILVDDVDATVAKATEVGGKVCFPAFDAPGVGRIARINDPQGAGFYVIKLLSAA